MATWTPSKYACGVIFQNLVFESNRPILGPSLGETGQWAITVLRIFPLGV